MRPLIHETFEECKIYYFDSIHDSQNMIKVLQQVHKITSEENIELINDIIRSEQSKIKTTYADLKEIQRWWIREGQKNRENKQLLEEATSTRR